MIDIFVSYSRKDAEYVEWIKPVLKRLQLEDGVCYYQDADNIIPGEEINESVNISIGNASVIICFLSNNFFASTFIQERELPGIETAAHTGATILPVIIDNVYLKPDSFFATVQHVNYGGQLLVDLKNNNSYSGFVAYFEEIIRETLKKLPLKPKKPITARYNIVVVGKAGAGKSELVNYLFGKPIRPSGIGTPITQIGFQETPFEIADVPASIFDSAGLEVGSYNKWKAALDDEFSRRGPKSAIHNWFHTVLYCVQATGSRIEDFELGIINRFITDKYKVIVVITKCYISQNKITELENSIKHHVGYPIQCVHVNSVDEEIAGNVVKAFGKAALAEAIQVALIESLTDRIPSRCIAMMHQYIDEQCDRQINYINNSVSDVPRNILADSVKSSLHNLTNDIKSPNGYFRQLILRETKNTLAVYSEILGIMEQAIIVDERNALAIAGNVEDMPKIKSFGKRLVETIDEAADWDLTEEYGEFVDIVSKVLAAPFIAIVSFFTSAGNHIEEMMAWRNTIIIKINDFRNKTKDDLLKRQDEIKRLYIEGLRQQKLL
jgi:GTP-binding protein EngB required for normal cell division